MALNFSSERPRRATVLNYFADGVHSDSNDQMIKQHTFDGRNLEGKYIANLFEGSNIKKVRTLLYMHHNSTYSMTGVLGFMGHGDLFSPMNPLPDSWGFMDRARIL